MTDVNNEEKMFELMNKMYLDFSKRFDNLKSEIKENRNSIVKLESKIENEVYSKIRALFDGYKQSAENLTRIEEMDGSFCFHPL
jgi:hypothetical protein